MSTDLEHGLPPLRVWYVYPGEGCRRDFYHCIRARSAKHALKVARLYFKLSRNAYARCPTLEERARDLHNALAPYGGYVTPLPPGCAKVSTPFGMRPT